MALTLHFHPLSSYCHKALVALYENGIVFRPEMVDLSDPGKAEAYRAVSPMGKMPALVDSSRGATVWETTILIDYLDTFYPGATRFIPADADAAWRNRRWDRFFDLYIHDPMQRIVAETFRPEAQRQAAREDEFRAQILRAFDYADGQIGGGWIMGDAFSLADCAAAPALFYASILVPFEARHASLSAYLDRLMRRPSYARVLEEAKPWFNFFPYLALLRERFPHLAPE